MPDAVLAVTLASADERAAVELEVSFVTEDDTPPLARQRVGRIVRQAAAALGAQVLGAAGAVHVLGGAPLQAVVGLGPRAEINLEGLRRAAAHAVGCATELRRTALAINVPRRLPASLDRAEVVRVLAEGALLAAHARLPRPTLTPKPDTLRPPERCVLRLPERGPPATTDAPGSLGHTALEASLETAQTARVPDADGAVPEGSGGGSGVRHESAVSMPVAGSAGTRITAVTGTAVPAAASGLESQVRRDLDSQAPHLTQDATRTHGFLLAEAGLRRAEAHAAAVRLARELGDMPANRLSPRQLAERAADAARMVGVDSEVLGPRELEALGAGLLLAVGGGSARPPALGVLRYRPPGATRHVAVVGKGITFDAGGISAKPAKGMADMVHDKAGAAAAAAVAFGAALLELPVAVTAILACAENLPSGAAYRPGDVLVGMDGASVEVIDTDAEGRLVLADALTYALRLSEPRPVDAIVDLATLTGSIVSALGNEAAGLFSNDDALAARMLAAAATAGEPLWRMPILPGHRSQLKSERADRKQCGERWGDCAIAAAFLEMYVDKRPWLHLDIAGVAYNEGSPEWPPYHPKNGAAGTGVRSVLHFLESLN